MHEFTPKIRFKLTALVGDDGQGTPKCETHPESRARAQESAVASAIGIASGQ